MKKLLSAFIAACVMLSAFPVTAFAANGPSSYFAYLTAYDAQTEVSYRLYVTGGEVTDLPEGLSYDLATNTVTLDSFINPNFELYSNMMGDDLRVTVNGECELGRILIYGYGYGGSLTIDGSGTLTVNADKKNNYGITLLAETSESALTLGKNVKLKAYGKERAVMINATTLSDADKAFVLNNGASTENIASERIEYDDAEYVEILNVEEGWTRYEGYRVNRSSDPDGIYAVYINEYDGEKYYTVNRFGGIEGYNVLVEDVSFTLDPMTEEEFENSEYSFVTDELPIKLLYTNREYEKERRGWRAHKMINKEDPDGIYAAGFVWYGSGSTDRDPDEYIIYHLLWDETEECYVQDMDFELQFIEADELAASPYELAYEEVQEEVTVRYWYYNEPNEDNFEMSGQLMTYSEDPDGVYVLSGTYQNSNSAGQINTGYIIDELYYDEENDCYYRDPSGEFGTHKTFYIKTSEFEESGFSRVYTTSLENKEIRYINDDYFFEEYAFTGYRTTHSANPGSVYVARPYSDEVPPTSYMISRLIYDEAKGRYYEDDDFNLVSLEADELEEYGYTIETSEQPVEFYSSGMIDNYSMPIYTDKDGNRYLVRGNEVYDYIEDNTVNYFGKELPVPVLNTEVSVSDLTVTNMHYVTDYFNHYTNISEFFYNLGDQPAYVPGDVDGDGIVTINDATTIQYYLAELLQTPLTETQKLAADFNNNGIIDIDDATKIQYLLADLL